MSMGNIGKSVIIKGELSGSEDLTIEGQVEGKIELNNNVLTIGTNAKIKAQVFAKTVMVLGEVTGNITASEKVDIRDNGSVDGDITSPKVAIAEGAHFRGAIDMNRGGAAPSDHAKAEAKPRRPGDRQGLIRVTAERRGAPSCLLVCACLPCPTPPNVPCRPGSSAGPVVARAQARAVVTPVRRSAPRCSPSCSRRSRTASHRSCSTSARSSAATCRSSASSSAASCASRISTPTSIA